MLQLASIFTNHMVLQRNKNIAVWGECDGERVSVSCNGHTVCAVSEDGHFHAVLPPMPAGGPYTMQAACGTEQIFLEDVMVGEVWFAGGQSNMELELQNSFNGQEELEQIAAQQVRCFYVPKYAFACEEYDTAWKNSTWECADREVSGKWSAVAYYFAKELSGRLGVTVGIINCNWGGTSASCWMSREMLEQNRAISSYIEEYDRIVENQVFEEYVKEREEYILYQTEFEKNVSHYYETAQNPTWDEAIALFGENKYPGPMGPYSEFRPAGLYQMMVSRICPYTLQGFIYYQGEEDDHKAASYYELLSSLVKQWRGDWQDDSLAFLVVQLPVFQNVGEPDFKNWPLIREAQMRLFQTVKNTGIAVILEQGEYGNIHPTKKEPVGHRLALQAFCQVYQLCSREEAFGPVYCGYFVEGNTMTVLFDYAADGFVCKGDVTGFELAGADRVYYPAEFTIQGSQIALTSAHVEEPVYARYAWTNYQEIGLFGKNGLPAAPFRTSCMDGSTITGSRLSNEGVM